MMLLENIFYLPELEDNELKVTFEYTPYFSERQSPDPENSWPSGGGTVSILSVELYHVDIEPVMDYGKLHKLCIMAKEWAQEQQASGNL